MILAGKRGKRIFLRLRHLLEVIQEQFGDHCHWGAENRYSVAAADDESVWRRKLAESRLGPYFLQLYCDDCWPPMEN
jgi:hypothetical protein